MRREVKGLKKGSFYINDYDVVVVGAGHAGIEAALASARIGAATAVFTLSLDAIGNLPCNPSIGGTAKGHLVMEVDALGGEIGRAADATTIQSRMLNRTKGPAVHSLRAQCDRRRYSMYMKHVLEEQENLDLIQDEIIDIAVEDGKVIGVYSRIGAFYGAECVVIATGTYLAGRIHIGETNYESGPDNLSASEELAKNLLRLGIPIRRFKTGTPARVNRRSIDFSCLEKQGGDDEITPFCFSNELPIKNQRDCYIAYTNENTHQIIRDNLHRSPLYTGVIEGIGPRYCPSIEDKVVRFPDRKRHQLFIEPCGLDTEELYLQGMSSSLPFDVQLKLYRTIKGLENVEIMRAAYAIEYDCCNPLSLYPTLESKIIRGLFGAGQFNGSSGYEEAAAQGLIAGVNAAFRVLGKGAFTLGRETSYIGTLIDDLVTKGVDDPYRMLTSRSEYRLLLRQDNVDIRLCETGRRIGLLSSEKYSIYLKNKEALEEELERIKKTIIPASEQLNRLLVSKGLEPVTSGISLEQLLKRPPITYENLKEIDLTRPADLTGTIEGKVETEVKYEGYINRQLQQIVKFRKLETTVIPEDIDYSEVKNLSLEAVDKLTRVKPASIGQASRISGVNPSDIAVLTVYIRKGKRF